MSEFIMKPKVDFAFKQLQIISQDKQKRLEYEAREKAIRDHNQGILEAELRGKTKGQTKMILLSDLRKKVLYYGVSTTKNIHRRRLLQYS